MPPLPAKSEDWDAVSSPVLPSARERHAQIQAARHPQTRSEDWDAVSDPPQPQSQGQLSSVFLPPEQAQAQSQAIASEWDAVSDSPPPSIAPPAAAPPAAEPPQGFFSSVFDVLTNPYKAGTNIGSKVLDAFSFDKKVAEQKAIEAEQSANVRRFAEELVLPAAVSDYRLKGIPLESNPEVIKFAQEQGISVEDAVHKASRYEAMTQQQLQESFNTSLANLRQFAAPQEAPPEDSWGKVISTWPSLVASGVNKLGAGLQRYPADVLETKTKLHQARLQVLPGAIKDQQEKGIPYIENTQVIDAARQAGVSPEEFLSVGMEKYANLTPQDIAQMQGEHYQNVFELAGRQERLDPIAERARLLEKASSINASDWSAKRLATEAVGSLPDLAAVAGSTVLGGPEVGALTLGALVAPKAYEDIRQTHSAEDAGLATGLTTAAEYLGEIPVLHLLAKTPASKKLLARLVGKFSEQAGGKLVGTAISEGVGESVTEALQIGINLGLYDENVPIPEALNRLAKAGVLGSILGTAIGVGPYVADRAEDKQLAELKQAIALAREAHEARKQNGQPVTQNPQDIDETGAPPGTMPAPADTGSPPPGPGEVQGLAPILQPGQESAIEPPMTAPAPQVDPALAPTDTPPLVEPASVTTPPPQTEVPSAQAAPPVSTPTPTPHVEMGVQPGEVQAGGTTQPAKQSSPAPRGPLTMPDPNGYGMIDEESPASRASLNGLLSDPDAHVRKWKPTKTGGAEAVGKEPEWVDIGNGFSARQWVEDFPDRREPKQQIRAPSGAIATRGLDSNGRPYSELEHGNLDELLNGEVARQFAAYFGGKPKASPQAPTQAALPSPAPASQTPVSKRETASPAQEQIAKLETSADVAEKKGDVARAKQLREQANRLRKSAGAIEQKPARKRAGKPESTESRLNENAPGYTVDEHNAPDDADSGMTVEEGNDDAQAEFDRLQAAQAQRNTEGVGGEIRQGEPKRNAPTDRGAERTDGNRPQATERTTQGRQANESGRDTTREGREVPTDRRGVDRAAEPRQEEGRTAGGNAPREGWENKTAVTKNGKPQAIWRGGNREVGVHHFTEGLGKKTDHPSSGLGVFFTQTEEDAAKYGKTRSLYLDIRNPYVVTNAKFPGFESHEAAVKLREELIAKGYDGVRLINKEAGSPDWFVAFNQDQVIHDPGEANVDPLPAPTMNERDPDAITDVEEIDLSSEFEDDNADEGGTLADDSLAAKTGRAPTGPPVTQRAGTAPSDPLRRIAARKAVQAKAAIEKKDTTPDVAPKRDTQLGRSTFDSMWRDLLGIPEVGPPSPAQEEKLRRIQNSPMSEQIKIATKMVNERFAFQQIILDPKLSTREQMDVLLDAYNNLHTMASVMSLPRQAMGFNGDLTLQLSKSIGKSKGTRGQFQWSFTKGFKGAVITLARRADSFTHEWLHALDLNLLMRFYKARVGGVSELSAYTTQPLDKLPPKVSKAFTDVMRSLFLVDEAAAEKMAELTAKAALKNAELEKAKAAVYKAGANVKPESTAKVEALKKEVADTQDAISELLNKSSSQLHQGSRYVDALSGGQYFSIPTEMLARAGESWMGNRVGQQAGTEFLSGSPNFYNNHADRIMQLVYPNAAEREGIFQKFDALFAALAEEQYFKGDLVAGRVPVDTMFDKELAQAAMANEQAGAVKRAYEDTRNDFVNMAMAAVGLVKGSWVGSVASGTRGAIKNFKLSNLVTSFWSAAGRVDGLIRAYKDNPKAQALIRKLGRKLALNPGAREETEGATVQDRIDRKNNLHQKTLDNIVKAYNIDPSNQEQMADLYEELVRPTEQVRQELKDHNKFLEERLNDPDITDEEHADIESNLQENNAVLKMTPLPEVPETNIQKAALAIRKLQDRLYYEAHEAGIDLGYVSNYMRRALNHEAIANDHDGFLRQATLAYRATNALNARKLERQIARADSEREKAALKSELAEIKRLRPNEQAEAYLWSLTVPDIYTPQSLTTPSTKFTKHRTLAPAADLLLADFYDQNPIRSLYNSISASTYRTTFAEMFGANGEKLDVMRKELVAAGVKETDLPILDDAVRIAFGQTGNFVSTSDAFVNWAMLLAQVKLLGRSAFSNFMEPAVTGLRTGNILDSFEALARTYLPILDRADAAEQQFVMETLGLVASTAHETVFANRTGLSGDNALLRQVYTGFGKLSKVQWLTERGRMGSFRVLANYLHHISLQAVDGNGARSNEAHDELNELGIPRDQHAAFCEFMRSLPKGRMGMDMMMQSGNQEMKEMYGNAMHVLIRQSIQSPQRVERARGSFHPVGRFIFSITGFTRSFERNVIMRGAKQIYTAKGLDRKTLAAARFGSTAGALVLLTMLSNMAREWWDDPDRAKKKLKDGDYFSGKGLINAIDRAGFTGRFSPAVNIFTKLKFDREVSSLTAGAVPSFYIDSFVKMGYGLKPGASDKQERAGWAAFYDLTVGMGAPVLAAKTGVTGPIGWLAVTKLQSRGVRDAVSEWLKPKSLTEREADAKKEARANEAPEATKRRADNSARAKDKRLQKLADKYGVQP